MERTENPGEFGPTAVYEGYRVAFMSSEDEEHGERGTGGKDTGGDTQ